MNEEIIFKWDREWDSESVGSGFEKFGEQKLNITVHSSNSTKICWNCWRCSCFVDVVEQRLPHIYFFGCFWQVPKMFVINFVQILRPQSTDPNEVSSLKFFDGPLIWIEDWENNSQMIIKLFLWIIFTNNYFYEFKQYRNSPIFFFIDRKSVV